MTQNQSCGIASLMAEAQQIFIKALRQIELAPDHVME